MGVLLSAVGMFQSSGGFTGGFWWGLGATLIGNAIVGGTTTGPREHDKTRQTSDGNWPIPLAFGKVRLVGNMIWCSDLKEGKKGGSKKKGTPSTWSYRQSALILFCEGPIERFEKLSYNAEKEYLWKWNNGDQKGLRFNEEKINNVPTGVWHSYNKRVPIGQIFSSDPADGQKALLLGTDNHTVLPQMETIDGAGNVPAYNHRCCYYSHYEDLQPWGQQFPQVNAWVDALSNDVADIIRVLLGRCSRALGYPVDVSSDVTRDLDVSQLRGLTVEGLVVSDQRGAVRAIEQLALVHGFDFVRAGYQLVARLRSSYDLNSVRRLDLPTPGAGVQWGRPNGGQVDPVQVRGSSALQGIAQTPGRFEMTFFNPAKKNRSDWVRSGFFPGLASGTSGAFPARSTVVQSVDTTLTIDRALARTITRRALYEIQLARKSKTHHCAPSLVDSYPSELVFDGQNIYKIAALNSEMWGPQHLTLSPFDLYLYNRMAPDTGIETVEPDLVLEYVDPMGWHAELLALPFYALASGMGTGTDSVPQGDDLAAYNRSNTAICIGAAVDNTSTFGTPLCLVGTPEPDSPESVRGGVSERFIGRTPIGRVVSNLSPKDEFAGYTDDSFQIDILGGTLESVAPDRWRQGFSSPSSTRPDGSVGSPANVLCWEHGYLISYRDAVLDGIVNTVENNISRQWFRYTLSGIRYGLWGSDDVKRDLTVNDRCALLWDSQGSISPGWVLKKWPTAQVGQNSRQTVYTGQGQVESSEADGVEARNFVYQGESSKPLAPRILSVTRGENKELLLSGIARTKTISDGFWEGSYPLPIYEQMEPMGYRYELVLIQGNKTIKTNVFTLDNRASYNWSWDVSQLATWGLNPDIAISGTLALVDRGVVGRSDSWSAV